jgi:hypothetical protein
MHSSSPTGEFVTTARIRGFVFSSLRNAPFFLPDAPTGVLIIIRGDERPTSPELPPWMARLEVKKNSIRLRSSSLVVPLVHWPTHTVTPVYSQNRQ